jgi:hypothetical protein
MVRPDLIEGEHIHYVTDVLDRIKASGYTVFSNISGKGHSGFHEGHLMFNDTSSLQMILTVVPEEKLDAILIRHQTIFGPPLRQSSFNRCKCASTRSF